MIVWIATIAVAFIVILVLGLVLFTAWTAHQVEANLPPCGKFIDIDGVRLHYVDKGRGPVLLLIHGLAGQVLNFTHSLLGQLAHDFRVVILDRPGSGYSLRPDDAMTPLAAQAHRQPLLSGAGIGASSRCRAFAWRRHRAGSSSRSS